MVCGGSCESSVSICLQWQRRQVCESEAVLIDTEFISRLIEEPRIEFRCARNNGDSFGLRMQAKRNLKCWRKLSLHENAADMRRQ